MCQWGILVAFAKLGTPQTVGDFALGLAITAPIMVFSNLQLRSVLTTDAREEHAFADYFGLRLVNTALALAVIAVVATRYAPATAWVILLTGSAKAVESISDIFFGLLQRREELRYMAISMIGKGILMVPAAAIALYLGRTAAWGVAGMLVVWIGVLAFYELPVLSRLQAGAARFVWNAPAFARLAWSSLPLGFVMMLVSFNSNIPRYFIEDYQGRRQLGVYAALAYIPVAGSSLINAAGQAISARLALYYGSAERAAFIRLLVKVCFGAALLGLGLTAVAAFGGDQLLTLVYQAQYTGQRTLFVLLMAGGGIGFVASLLGYAMTATRLFRIQLPLQGCVTLVTFIASAILIPRHGLVGAGLSVLMASCVQLGLSAAVVAWALRKS